MQVIFIRRHLLLAAGGVTVAFGMILYTMWQNCVTSLQEERLQSLASGLYKLMEQKHDSDFTSFSKDSEDEVPNWLAPIKKHQSSPPHQTGITFETRATEYCRPLSHIMQGEEGKINTSLELVSVHVIIRHGDRSPIYGLPGIKPPRISCLFHDQPRQDNTVTKYLKWSAEMNLTSGKYYPSNPLCNGGQLTPQGMLQHISNGQFLASSYRASLLNQTYINKSAFSIYIRTNENSRNVQSALAFTYGLVSDLSRVDYSVANMEVSDLTNFCSSNFAKVPCHCPVLDIPHTHKHLSKEHAQILRYNPEYSKIKAKFAAVLGVTEGNVPWLGAGLDVLMSYTCHHQHLPCVSQTGKCTTPELVSDMWRVIDQTAETEFKAKTKRHYGSLLMYPLLREIAYRLRNITNGLLSPAFVLYSGHDKMLIPMAIALGVYNGKWPGYASRLVIELYRGTKSRYYLRLLFNGKDMTTQMKLCTKFEQGLCPLSQFLKSVFSQSFVPSNSYRKICNGSRIKNK